MALEKENCVSTALRSVKENMFATNCLPQTPLLNALFAAHIFFYGCHRCVYMVTAGW